MCGTDLLGAARLLPQGALVDVGFAVGAAHGHELERTGLAAATHRVALLVQLAFLGRRTQQPGARICNTKIEASRQLRNISRCAVCN